MIFSMAARRTTGFAHFGSRRPAASGLLSVPGLALSQPTSLRPRFLDSRRRPLRWPGPELSASGVPEQDRSRHGERRGRAPASRPDAGVLRLLRLAFRIVATVIGCWFACCAVSECAVRVPGARRVVAQLHAGQYLRRSRSSGRVMIGRRSSGPTGSRGCCNFRPGCVNGRTRKPDSGWPRCSRCSTKSWLPTLHYPIRIGEHDQTAFSSGWCGIGRCGGRYRDASVARRCCAAVLSGRSQLPVELRAVRRPISCRPVWPKRTSFGGCWIVPRSANGLVAFFLAFPPSPVSAGAPGCGHRPRTLSSLISTV